MKVAEGLIKNLLRFCDNDLPYCGEIFKIVKSRKAIKMNINELFSTAYTWLCKSRLRHPHNADIWDFRWRWANIKDGIGNDFISGKYQFDIQFRRTLAHGELIDIYTACDALVIKALALILETILLPLLSLYCYHVKGRGGLKGAVRSVAENLDEYTYVFRTDVKSYYDSIDHHILISKLGELVKDDRIHGFVWKYLNRVVEWNGVYHEVKKGIPMGSSLSPLLGAFYLRELDVRLAIPGVFYARYMDDILIMTTSRWRLRHAIKILNEEFELLGLLKHPQKTSMGRVAKGFEFLGYHYGRDGLSLAEKTIDNFMSKALRLYEQEPVQTRLERLGEYTKRWVRWTTCGLQSLEIKVPAV
jgi:hypothetical protein